MFERPHHRLVAAILESLDPEKLASNACWFGGGTAMALRFGEYRESVDIDFLVSDLDGYRALRQMLAGRDGLDALARPGHRIPLAREVRVDQYGIRTQVRQGAAPVKFEIVHEGRIPLDPPTRGDRVCGIATLTKADLLAEKLLANADRWPDDGVFSRDLIDLAMARPTAVLLEGACIKAEVPYGRSVRTSVQRAIEALRNRPGRLETCVRALRMTHTPAQVWQAVRRVGRVLAPA